jgi:hypothetical protein
MAWPLAQSRATIAGLQYLIIFFAALSIFSGVTVNAGAWTPQAGHVNVILSTSISQTPVADHALTTDLYYERGLGHGFALVLAPSVSDQNNVFSRNEAQVSLRRSLYQNDGWAVSTQLGAFVWKEEAARAASSGAEVRLAVGKSFGNGGWANVETAVRGCGGVNGLRWEGTVGHKVRRHDHAIVKVFGDSEGCTANITRVQASYVYGLSSRVGVEMGWRETLPNRGRWNERGAVIGLWLTF